MAIFSRLVLAATAFAALCAARPLAVRDVSVVTETDYTTVDVPVTVWVDENGTPLTTVAQGGNFAASATPVANSPVNSPSPSSSPVAETPKVIQSSASPSMPQQPAAAVPTTTAAPQPPAGPQAPAYNAPSQSPSSSASAPSPTPPATNKGSSGQTGSLGSSTASCDGESNACSGDITHWDGGLGACGWNVNTDSDMQVALPVGFMGAQSNGNPYCGKSLTIRNPTNGQTVQATVGDKCMGCVGRSIDLTNALFTAIGANCDGRCSGFDWWFN